MSIYEEVYGEIRPLVHIVIMTKETFWKINNTDVLARLPNYIGEYGIFKIYTGRALDDKNTHIEKRLYHNTLEISKDVLKTISSLGSHGVNNFIFFFEGDSRNVYTYSCELDSDKLANAIRGDLVGDVGSGPQSQDSEGAMKVYAFSIPKRLYNDKKEVFRGSIESKSVERSESLEIVKTMSKCFGLCPDTAHKFVIEDLKERGLPYPEGALVWFDASYYLNIDEMSGSLLRQIKPGEARSQGCDLCVIICKSSDDTASLYEYDTESGECMLCALPNVTEEIPAEERKSDMDIFAIIMTEEQHEQNFERFIDVMSSSETNDSDVLREISESIGLNASEVESLILQGEKETLFELELIYPKDFKSTAKRLKESKLSESCDSAVILCAGEGPLLCEYKEDSKVGLKQIVLDRRSENSGNSETLIYLLCVTDSQLDLIRDRCKGTERRKDEDNGVANTIRWMRIISEETKLNETMLLNLARYANEMSPEGPMSCCWSDYKDIDAVVAAVESGDQKITKRPIQLIFASCDGPTKLYSLGTTRRICVELKDEVSSEEKQSKERFEMEQKIMKEVKNTGSELASAGLEGLKQAGAQEVSERMISIVRSRLGDAYPKLLDNSIGRKAEPLVLAGVIHLAAGMFSDKIPQAENLRLNCKRVVTAEMKDNGREFFDIVVPLLAELSDAMPMVAAELADAEEAEVIPGDSQKKEKKGKKAKK